MAMTYSSLIAAKGTAGSLSNFLSYSKVTPEIPAILDESQALLYSLLRCREMLTKTRFTMTVGASSIALPSGFLDPIGRMYSMDYDMSFRHKEQAFVMENRNYTNSSGTLGTNPFTTTNGSNNVTVNLTGHGFNQESSFYTTGATAFNGVTITGTFDITSITDANNFVIDITSLGTAPSGSGAGGGAAVLYTVDNLIQGTPLFWAVWDEAVHFDQAFSIQTTCELPYFKSPALLSASNQSNFLTNRYPHLIRAAAQARAAAFMRDDETYARELQALTALTQSVSIENDMMYRGAEIETETP